MSKNKKLPGSDSYFGSYTKKELLRLIFEKYYWKLYYSLVKKFRNEDDAKDALQNFWLFLIVKELGELEDICFKDICLASKCLKVDCLKSTGLNDECIKGISYFKKCVYNEWINNYRKEKTRKQIEKLAHEHIISFLILNLIMK